MSDDFHLSDVVRARDLADAQRIAATCPHLRYGGQIVLRRAVS